ncbi:tRNA lysidine(34) synthetase TilS [Bifidobacterium leontopitheci]|uniref:tRNA(Ile)-lysidine synthase n=1 Tax=Bifidobacterium leontopitheci TaxID=2650774 RepID=A0A6I1GR10_9BIFI|nr:tRNA lysidine(34) synthetase TilS [Bifidobacterium leontopitheci]KAB7790588.1 tRNA(Ile)-lysidine synthetase [Bifidobacterium leontopitheci]
MVYTARLRKAVGQVRATLESLGLGRQSADFARHGEHETAADAPLVLVACSGGRDSMALAAVAATVCASLGLRCGAVIVDHGLQSGSDTVAADAAERCRALRLDPVVVRRVQVVHDGRGTESAARDARYAAVCKVARETGAAVVLLAHTRDDQAETVLLGLLRSAGVDALAGMPGEFERDGVRFARPLLDLSRADTTGICEDLGLTWWDDPTNGDVAAGEDIAGVDIAGGDMPGEAADAAADAARALPLRSRVRHELIPFMEMFAGGDVVTHLARGSRLVRLDKDYLDMQADRAMAAARLDPQGDLLRLDVRALEHEHPAIRLRALAHALAGAGVAASSAQIDAIDRLIVHWHGQGPVNLPSGCSAFRRKHVIRVCQDSHHANR